MTNKQASEKRPPTSKRDGIKGIDALEDAIASKWSWPWLKESPSDHSGRQCSCLPQLEHDNSVINAQTNDSVPVFSLLWLVLGVPPIPLAVKKRDPPPSQIKTNTRDFHYFLKIHWHFKTRKMSPVFIFQVLNLQCLYYWLPRFWNLRHWDSGI